MARKKTKTPKPIASTKHKDKRANIPTEELRDFVAGEERAPETILYPRDPSLDPQLVWQGKDEQDSEDLAVPAVPVYIQEKIHPQAIIEDVRAQAKKDTAQLGLFADFNGLEFEDLIEFYQHEQNWANRMILGDSLLVMTSLAEKEGLKGQVQMIYIDPPYGIKFGSNWQVSTRRRQVRDGKAEDVTRQPEQVKAFRDTWELGIHSYLAYLRDRLVVARELLTESGSVFVQIGDENVHLVRCLLDEVFGSENFVAEIYFQKTGSSTGKHMQSITDVLLWYAKAIEAIKVKKLKTPKYAGDLSQDITPWMVEVRGGMRKLTREELCDYEQRKDLNVFQPGPINSQHYSDTRSVPYIYNGEIFHPPRGRQWTYDPETQLPRLARVDRLIKYGNTLRVKMFISDSPFRDLTNIWLDTQFGGFSEPRTYVVQTGQKVIERCLLMTTDPGDLVLDPTCGSGTTAYAAEQWGRRWITVDTSRVALALARTRLMTARYPYYLLADSPEGIQRAAEMRGQVPPTPLPKTNGDIKQGFVYRQVPHITLRDIARNEEIDTIHEKWQAELEPLRAQLNQLLRHAWEDWEIPREPQDDWPQAAKDLLRQWWELRRARQEEIDASIARHSESETLYDQPYEDRRKLRVTGPFTVESLSPHRVLSTDEERPASEAAGQQADAGSFERMIIENLKKAGVQNTIKNERLKFDRLEPYAGEWIQAEGEYTETPKTPGVLETPGVSRRVALAIGPEHGTAGPQLIKEAAKEAVRGLGFDLLIVCGFAFDPHVAEETRRYGRLAVLTARMNPDLAMGDTLLKKTGSGNLFMVFGEPDVEIRRENGQVIVEIKGLDIYDPTTGEIRASSTSDIACWFIDTNYNEESFFVRHAYFTGADKPYEKLKRALRAEVDQAAWAALYSTVSRPFDPPETGKIAVKVINHYGDEVLHVYEV
ncbi:MAG: site-specific DNA-methyltransferase [Anaerolineae bacterium]